MNNYKIKVNSKDESKEVQGLFFELGYEKGACSWGNYPAVIVTTQDWATGNYCSTRALGLDVPAHGNYIEITLAELRDMVVLRRNDVNDATHACETKHHRRGYLSSDGIEYIWSYGQNEWFKAKQSFNKYELKPIEKTMREFLNINTFAVRKSDENGNIAFGRDHADWIEIPEGAEIAIKFKYDPDDFGVIFYKNNGKSCFSQNDKAWQNDADWTMKDLLNEDYCEDGIDLSHDVLWQREQDEPFLTPECTLNDQYAELGQVRQVEIHGAIKAEPDLNFGAAQASGGVDATLAERQSQYGCYEDVAHVTQQILSALRIGNYDKLPAPMKESLHMIASKMARIVNGDPEYFDNWHDISGYAKLIEKLIKGE